MNLIPEPSWLLLAQSALERWQGAKSTPDPSFGWQWLLVFGMFLALFAIAGWVVIWIRIRRGTYARNNATADLEATLSAAEVDLLGSLILESGLIRPGVHFSIARAVQVGMGNFLQNQTFLELDDRERDHIDAALEGLKGRLGITEIDPPADAISTADIPIGAKLKVTQVNRLDDLVVTVRTNSERGLAVEPAELIQVEIGTPWIIRYFDGHRMWEFNTRVTAAQANILRVEHVSPMRTLNIRRFQRVNTEGTVLVAPFPFHPGQDHIQAPEFQEFELAEIAGPGLRIRGDLDARVGDLLLLVVHLPIGELIQGVARVRRTFVSDRNVRNTGLELIGLNPSQIAELSRMTNDIEKRAHRLPSTKQHPESHHLQAG